MTIESVVVGFGGFYRVGEWTPLAVTLSSPESLPETVVVETVTLDADGTAARRTTVPLPVEGGSPAVVRTVFQAGRAGSPLTIRVRNADERVLAERRLLVGSPLLPAALPNGAVFAVVSGLFDATGDEGSSVIPVPESMTAVPLDGPLPADPIAYSAANVVIVRGNLAPSAEQAEALRRWVAGGGHLAVMLGRDTAAFRRGLLAKWVPTKIGDMVQLRDVSALKNFPRAARVQIAELGDGLEAFPPGAETPLVVGDRYGFGRVTLFAMDFDRPPFSTWPGLPDLIHRSIVREEPAGVTGRRLSSPGVTDLSTQLMRAEQSFPGVERRSVGSALLLLLLLAAIVGPLDYLIVHHLLRRPALTWVTLPAIVLIAGWWLHRSAIAANGTASRYNELHFVDVDAATETVRGHTVLTLYGADSARVDLDVSAPSKSDWRLGDNRFRPHLGWLAPPEATLGGAYREASGGLFQPEYRLPPPGESAQATDVPLLVWSSRQFLATWQSSGAAQLVEGEVVTSGAGRAEGSLIHRLPGPLTNVLVAVGDRVYVAQPGIEWYPNEPVLLESSLFQPRDLDSFLTRKTTVRVEREPGEGGEEFLVNESLYDPGSTDLTDVVTMLTFHTAAGGRGYTGLTNSVFASHDLSGQLEAGRAVVLGQIDVSASDVVISAENGTVFEPARRTTFVRLVIPTSRGTAAAPNSLTPLAPTEETPQERPPRR